MGSFPPKGAHKAFDNYSVVRRIGAFVKEGIIAISFSQSTQTINTNGTAHKGFGNHLFGGFCQERIVRDLRALILNHAIFFEVGIGRLRD